MIANTKKTLLIIEDEKPLSTAIFEKFTKAGFTILQAYDGEEGLSVAFEKHPDLILLDILMPKMDGMSVLQKLRQDEWGKDVPVIVMSNISDGAKIYEGLQHNIAGYIIKSDWKLEDLVLKVKDKLGLT